MTQWPLGPAALLEVVPSEMAPDFPWVAYKGVANYLHQIVFLIQVRSFSGTRPTKISSGREFATMPFFYTSFPNGELKLVEK
jgi:hypothetical protein